MKLAVVGSRSFNDYSLLKEILDEYRSINNIDVIISGGAIGADSLAEKYARENNIETLLFLPDWKKHGKSAGMIRNQDIIKNCDTCIAFWDGSSKGTKHSISLAEKNNKKIIVINVDD